ncbi:MAG: hypothetical protein Q4F50_09745 [Bacteroides sp.]|uniref:hypothetical protein n=1 Tax=Bacteroides sp. TaxID=29523 RepID=UPI0026DF6E6A|nr:hypothetical protein [Bacteroides sp.]MDO5420328.1 hypothetical protein [Bacteroides sp.]
MDRLQQLAEPLYESPRVECMEVCVEAGFAGSLQGTGNESFEEEAGSWGEV